MKNKPSTPANSEHLLLDEIKNLIDQTKSEVARAVNTGLVMLYWNIGKRIKTEILKNKRADYGEQIVATLSRQLELQYGEGFKRVNLTRMVKFYELFQDIKIVASLRQQLTWTHFRELIPIKDPLKRDFYAEMCRIQNWSVRMLRKQIDSMLFERTAIAKNPTDLIESVNIAREKYEN